VHKELGPLAVQLRGQMERVSGGDGTVDWVSLQGKDAWLAKHRVSPAVAAAAAAASDAAIPPHALLLLPPIAEATTRRCVNG
jgi:hypothetical protein